MLKGPFQYFKVFLFLVGVGLIVYNVIGLEWEELFSRQNQDNFLGILANILLALAMWISIRHTAQKNENGKIK